MNTDPFGRKVDYLRLAVTYRCNFACVFCSPQNYDCIPDEEELSDDEIFEICTAAVKVGFKKIRLTGGEPLLRPGILQLAGRLSTLPGLDELAMTTNGTELNKFAKGLRTAGINRVNVNLPSIDAQRFRRITGQDALEQVMSGIRAARMAGIRIKLNIVVLSDMSEEEVAEFGKFSEQNEIKLRFIEYMPLATDPNSALRPLSMSTLRSWIRKHSVDAGVIASMERPFCATCNRLRVTSSGKIHPCLFGAPSHDVKSVLNSGTGEIAKALREAIAKKPAGYFSAVADENFRPMIRAVGG